MAQTLMNYVDHGPALPVCDFGLQFLMRISLLNTHASTPHSDVAQLVAFVSFVGFTA